MAEETKKTTVKKTSTAKAAPKKEAAPKAEAPKAEEAPKAAEGGVDAPLTMGEIDPKTGLPKA